MSHQPNVLFIFADQWRAQAFGYANNPDVKTPHIDALAAESVHFTQAISGCPVCTPYRASLLTGQYPLTHGLFINDTRLDPEAETIGKRFRAAGYSTGWIGKWHVDGHGRTNPIPLERQQGFDYWKVLECTHDYNQSRYYEGNDSIPKTWDGYDAIAQTKDAISFIKRNADQPFALFLSWGPPHAPYETAPQQYRAMYDPGKLTLRANVAPDVESEAREMIAGYYAHCTALDDCMAQLLATLETTGQAENTILVFTSDHGDMLGSQGHWKKQRPFDESVRVPFLIRWPEAFGSTGREVTAPIDAPDLMPTLLGLCDIDAPDGVEGLDYSGFLVGGPDPSDGVALLQCPVPFHQWLPNHGGREYRGIRTSRYTYVRDLTGPWLLYDNQGDPFQKNNVVNHPDFDDVQAELDAILQRKLVERNDAFSPGPVLCERWGYRIDDLGSVIEYLET